MNADDHLDTIATRLVDPMITYKENATEDAPALVAALQAVLDLHGPSRKGICVECIDDEFAGPAEWPCDTVRAVEAALGGTQ